MGAENTIVNQWLSDRGRFADLFNGTVFEGRRVVLPEDLTPLDRETDIMLEDKGGNRREIRRNRDIVMSWENETCLAILANESQRGVDYAMPVRTMMSDCLTYTDQLRQKWKTVKETEGLTGPERLSRCRKGERLIPVITLVFYYGAEPWDGSKSLYEMLGFGSSGHMETELPEADCIRRYVPDYWINLIEAGNVKDAKRFRGDLQMLFEMLKYKKDQDGLYSYVHKHENYFGQIDRETWLAYQEFLQIRGGRAEKIFRKCAGGKEEKVNMCKALEDLYETGYEKGRSEGREEGRSEGLAKGVTEGRTIFVRNMLARGMSDADICALAECEQSIIDEIRGQMGTCIGDIAI